MPLWPHQFRALAGICAANLQGARVVACVAPTGAGKTRIAAEWAIDRIGRGVWVAHREELLTQARAACTWPCDFISIQSIDPNVGLPEADWYVLDEGHHYYGTEQWSRSVAPARKGPTLLLTATPERADGRGMRGLVDAIVTVAQPRELIDAGFLVPCDVLAAKEKTRSLTEDPVVAWKKWGEGRQAVVFCRDVAHARKVALEFNAGGIASHCIEGTAMPEARSVFLDAHSRGTVRILTTVQVLTEGWDSPGTSCAIMARGFSSAGAWVQAIGRIVRAAPGKTKAICIDLRGSVYDWGLPDEDRSYSLVGRGVRLGAGSDAIRQCRVCSRIFRAEEFKSATCPGCGAVSKGKPDPRVRRMAIEKVVAREPADKRRAWFAAMRGVEKSKGYKRGWAAMRYKAKYGTWPGAM